MKLLIIWDEDSSIEIIKLSKKTEERLNDPEFDFEEYVGNYFNWSNWMNHCTYSVVDEVMVRNDKRRCI